MIDEVTRMLDLDLHEVDAIAVSGGPGSYTGLRIGSRNSKGPGPGAGKTFDPCSDHGCHGLQFIWNLRAYLPGHGCQKRPGLYRTLSL